MTNFKVPKIGAIIPLGECALVVVALDKDKLEGTFRLFESTEAAIDAMHTHSLLSNPEWHAANCRLCKERKHETN